MKVSAIPLLIALFVSQFISAQGYQVDKVRFFEEETPLEATLIMDMRRLISQKNKEGLVFPATFITEFEDSIEVKERIRVEVRGKFRRETCDMPPLKLGFKNQTSPILSPLSSLKMVNFCQYEGRSTSELLLKEYLVYKIFNEITDKSFRVRLLRMSFIDSGGKRKPVTEYAFLIEDVKDLAKRNDALERKRKVAFTEATDRSQMTKVALFQYMIGNSDWSVPAAHNIKLIASRADTNAIPYAVPYDFDHSGLVNASYALPPPELPIAKVTDRIYRGFPRTFEEIETALDDFRKKKESIYDMIRNFELLPERTRKEMIYFLDGFYNTISRPSEVKAEFINNARRN